MWSVAALSLGVGCGVSTVLMPTGRHTRRSWSCTRCLGTFTYSERDASIADRRESKPGEKCGGQQEWELGGHWGEGPEFMEKALRVDQEEVVTIEEN